MSGKSKKPEKRKSTTGKEYEKIVANIHRHFGGDAIVTENEMINGRQIDVSVQQNVCGYDVLIIIECKDFGRKVGIGEVDEIIGKIEDTKASQAVLVSDSGFTSGALRRAKANGYVRLISVVDTDNTKLKAKITIPIIAHEHFFSGSFRYSISYFGDAIPVLKSKCFEKAVKKALTSGVDWFDENIHTINSGEITYLRTFDCMGSDFLLDCTIAKVFNTFVKLDFPLYGRGAVDHLASCLLPRSSLSNRVDFEDGVGWLKVSNDYKVANCNPGIVTKTSRMMCDRVDEDALKLINHLISMHQ